VDIVITHQLLPIGALILYLISALLLWRSVSGGVSKSILAHWSARLPIILAVLGAIAHAITLFYTTYNSGQLNFSFFNSLSVTAWFTVVLLLLISITRPILTLGLVVLPISALIVACAIVFARQQSLAVEPKLQWHVLISIIAYALLTMAAAQSIMVALQDKRLHAHRPGGLLRHLPPLKQMEQVLLQLLIASFLLLSLSLVTGFVFLDDLFAQRLVHKTTLSIVALILLALLLIGHYRIGWRGQKAAKMTLGAYAALLLGYFGSKFVKELLL